MKLLASIVSIVALGSALAAGSFAVFTDTETTTGTTFAAGTVDIEVNDQNPWTEVGIPATGASGDTLLKPSQVGTMAAVARNVGDNLVYLWMRMGDKVDSGGVQSYLCPGIGLVSSEPECAAEQALGHREDGISYHTIYKLVIQEPPGSPTTLKDGQSVHARSGYWVYLGDLPPGGEIMVTQSFRMDAVLSGNFQQGDKITFKVSFYASQVEGACRTPAGAQCPSPMPSIGTDFPE